MPNITAKVTGGTDKENLSAITLGSKRWGQNGAAWGTSQSVPVGNAAITAYYSSQQSSAGSVEVEETDTTLSITANGPDDTTCVLS